MKVVGSRMGQEHYVLAITESQVAICQDSRVSSLARLF